MLRPPPSSTLFPYTTLFRSAPSAPKAAQASPTGCGSSCPRRSQSTFPISRVTATPALARSEEHTSELQSLRHLVCRLLLEKKKKKTQRRNNKSNNNR